MLRITEQQLKDKIVFFDFDGVLGAYQATKDKVHIDENEYVQRQVEMTNPFEYSHAPQTLKNIISKLDSDRVYVLSNMASTFELRNKERFIRDNYPTIRSGNILFVSNDEYKVLIIEAIYKKLYADNYSKQQIVLVEDTIKNIVDVENAGFRGYHISSFLE